MALTRSPGALAQVQQQARQVTNNAAAVAQNIIRQNAQVQRQAAPAPVRQAPVFQQVQQQARQAIPSAAAAQQIINRSIAQRNAPQQNVIQQAGQRALQTALAVAGNQAAAATFQPRDVRVGNRMANAPTPLFTPQQESQLFDQQMQVVKAQASPTAWLDPVAPARMENQMAQIDRLRSGFQNAAPNLRLQQEGQALAAYPEISPNPTSYLRTLTDGQLSGLLDMSRQPNPGASYDPLSGPKAGTPQRAAGSAAGAQDAVVGSTPSFEMTRGYDPLAGPKSGTPPPTYNVLSGNKTGTQQVTDAMNGVIEGSRMPQGGGGVLGTLAGIGGGIADEFGEGLGDLYDWAKGSLGELKESAQGTYEEFMQTPVGQKIGAAMELLDTGRVMNTENYGEMFTQWANGETVAWTVGGSANPLNQAAALPVILIAEGLEEADPTIKDQIKTVSEEGYSSPSHIARLEAAGIDPETAPPQFSGDQAVWEFLMGKSDDWPPYLKYPARIVIDAVIDPLNYATAAGAIAGKPLRGYAEAMRAMEEAGTIRRGAGVVADVAGTALEVIPKAPDLLVEGPLKVVGATGRRIGEGVGLFSPSTKGTRIAEAEALAAIDEALAAGREGVTPGSSRASFDAETQGVTAASGPELLDTPTVTSAAGAPTVVAPTPVGNGRVGIQAYDSISVETNYVDPIYGYPSGKPTNSAYDTLGADVYKAQVRTPVATPGGGTITQTTGTTFDMGSGMGIDIVGLPFYIVDRGMPGSPKHQGPFFSLGQAVEAFESGADNWMPNFPAGDMRQAQPQLAAVGAKSATSKTGPTLADVNRQIAELRSNPPTGMAPREAAAEMTRLRTLRNDMRAGRVPSDGTTVSSQTTPQAAPPVTPVERQAAAAANSVPNRPRNAGEAGMAQAAASAKGKKIPTLRNFGTTPNVNKALVRARRLAKEEANNLPKKVNEILRPQTKGEHEFSPIYGGNRPLDKIVSDAVDSGDAATIKRAEELVKRVDDSVETNLRTDNFYQTWANGGAPVHLTDDPRYTDDFFEAFRAFEPDASPERLRVLASGMAKGTLDDIGMLGFQLNHLLPMIGKEFPQYLDDLTGVLGSVGRVESKNFREESAEWLVREYLDTPHAGTADVLLKKFLTGETELPVIADGVHKPYAHSIVGNYHAESIARLTQMRDQWTKIKQKAALNEVSDAPFRDADVAAQFAGSAKGGGKGVSRAVKAEIAKWKKPTPADIETAIGSIKDPELRNVLLKGTGTMPADAALKLDQMIPSHWSPPGYSGFPILGSPKTEWNLKEGLDWLHEYSAQTPTFDYLKARNELAGVMVGIDPRRTKAEVKSMKDAARVSGIDPALIKDGTSNMERITATRGIRALDGYLTALRSLRMFNVITGTPGRLGDILGNMVTHGVAGRDPWSAVRQLPLTFTSTYDYRKLARDPEKLIERWAIDSPAMAETGATYTKSTFSGSTKLSDEQTSQLPWLNDKVKGTPRGVRAVANLATAPYLKDLTVGGELIGRKMAFDRVFTHSLQHEGLQSFLAELKKTYPDTYQQVYQDILSSAREKGGKSWSGLFSYDDVRKVTDEKTARLWQTKINDAVVKGDVEADRLFFSNRQTNADEIARRTFTFHYWMVRASGLYARSFLQNPAMLSGVYRMYTELQQMAEEDNLPGWLGGMFKFYRTGGGMYGAFDPIGMLFPTIFMDAYSQEGNKFQAFQNLMTPPLSGALGALGLTQNIPDATGTRTIERFITDMGNFLKGEGVDLESIPGFGKFINTDSLTLTIPTEEFTKMLIDKANAFVGKPFGDFTPFDRGANEQDQLRSIGLHVGQGLWGDDPNTWTEAQHAELEAAITQAMSGDGEETWLSETIRAQYGQEGFIRAGASFFIPGGVVTRQEGRDADIEASHTYWDSFYAGKPTTKEGEIAATTRSLATSAQPLWVAMNNEYYEIGTKEQQKQYSVYNDLLFNPEELNKSTTIVVNNGNGTYTFFTAGELAGMEQDERSKILDAWKQDVAGMADAVATVGEGRKAFKAEHPDYGAFSEYQKGVKNYQGGVKQFRTDMADHPQFAAAMEAQRKELIKQGKKGAVLEAELDNWADSQAAFHAMMGKDWKIDDDLPGGTPGPNSALAMDRLRPEKEEEKSSGGSTKGTTVKDPNVDDYWGPEKGVSRLATDQAQYEHDNTEMERRFGVAWNESTGEWEDDYDSAKERDAAGLGGKTYVLPGISDTMRRYEVWGEEHPGGTPEEFFAEMLQTEGFGRKVGTAAAPTTSLPAGGRTVTAPGANGSGGIAGKAMATLNAQRGGGSGIVTTRGEQPAASTTATKPKSAAKVAIFGGKAYGLSQEYGMTDFASSESYPGGMYGYTSEYSPDGNYVGHMGVDIASPLGTPLYAPVSGTVVQAGGMPFEQDDRYGDQPQTGGLRIELPNGDIVVMAHMQQIDVHVGDTVSAGQPVGYSGTAGADPSDPGSGAHVHVEYRQYAPGQTGSGYLAIDPRTKLDLGL